MINRILLCYYVVTVCLVVISASNSTIPSDSEGSGNGTMTRPFPQYVLDYAPLTHLWSSEAWQPSDVADHLTHVVPKVNFINISEEVTFLNIGALSRQVFLSTKDSVDEDPPWMYSTENIPNEHGLSPAPATIICVEKDHGVVDAFYFMFYSYNKGNTVLGLPMGNHIGDWEYIMVRYVNSEPSVIYLSAHRGGFAYKYSALTMTGNRATTFIAGGTHANYVTPGSHYLGPLNLLNDRTDAGPIWDITLNFRGYWFHNATRSFSLAEGRGRGGEEQITDGTGWLKFRGRWGDQEYPIPQHGQYCIGENCRFSDGPTGPVRKNLDRRSVCEYEHDCVILSEIPTPVPVQKDSNMLWNSGNTPLHLVFIATGIFVAIPVALVFLAIGILAMTVIAILIHRGISKYLKGPPIQLADTNGDEDVERGDRSIHSERSE